MVYRRQSPGSTRNHESYSGNGANRPEGSHPSPAAPPPADLYRARLRRREKLAQRMSQQALYDKTAGRLTLSESRKLSAQEQTILGATARESRGVPPGESPDAQSFGAAPGVDAAKSTIAERRASARGRKMFRLPPSLLRSAFPPKSFGLRADCTDTQLLDALDQSWSASRGYTISGAAGLAGDDGTDDCAAPLRVTIALPGPVPAEDAAAFWAAYNEAAFQLPPDATQVHHDACGEQAWNEVFGPPANLSARDQVWAAMPSWCWVDKRFCEAFSPLFEALPEICTNRQLADALDQAWEDSQGDNWQ